MSQRKRYLKWLNVFMILCMVCSFSLPVVVQAAETSEVQEALTPQETSAPQDVTQRVKQKKLKVQDVSAVNGEVTITLSDIPEDTPEPEDFQLSVKGGLLEGWSSLEATDFAWDESSKTARIQFEPIKGGELDKRVTVRVDAYGSKKTAKSFLVQATSSKVFAVKIENLADDNILEIDSALDGSLTLKAVAYDIRGREVEGKAVNWSSSDRRVASVNEEGVVTAKAIGLAIIQAEVDHRIALFPVLVKKPGPSLSLSASSLHESDANDGGISDSLLVELHHAKFLPLFLKSSVQVKGLPEGLSYTAKLESEDRLRITFLGKAVKHEAKDSVDHVYVIVKHDMVFGALSHLVSPKFSINFKDSKNTKAPVYLDAKLDEDNKRITLRFDDEITLAVSEEALRDAIQTARNGSDFISLTEGDLVSIKGQSLIVTLAQGLRGNDNKIRLQANTIQNTAGNLLTETVVSESLAASIASIADLKQRVNEVVTLQGIVTADNASLGGGKLSTYIQDETAGINLFASKWTSYPDLKEGDLVQVTGKIVVYKNLTEIIPETSEDIVVVSTGNQVPEAKSLTVAQLNQAALAEKYEGMLISSQAFLLSVPNSESGGGYNLRMIDEHFQGMTVRVMKESIDVAQLTAGKWYQVEGVLAQYNDLYQILPRKQTDLLLLQDQLPTPQPKEAYPSIVKDVVDGDTIHLSQPVLGVDTVRFVNMDTAETYHIKDPNFDYTQVYNGTDNSSKDKNQKAHGERAKQHLKKLIAPGDSITIKPASTPIDAYGRLLAEVILPDGRNVNLEMVKDGYASMYIIWPVKDETFKQYAKAVKEAKQAGIGIWNAQDPLSELPFEFRAREQKKVLSRPVGDAGTKFYVQPLEFQKVAVENRVFFNSTQEAEQAGYTLAPTEEKHGLSTIRQLPDKTPIVTATGVVSTVSDSRNSFYIQDDKAGILVFQPTTQTQVKPGDVITITKGLKDTYNGEVEIMQAEFSITGTVNEPQAISVEASQLIKKQGMLIRLAEATVSQVTPSKLVVETSTGSIDVFLGKYGVSLPELREKDAVDVTGIASIFKGSAQVYPRSVKDIVILRSGLTDADRVATDKAALFVGDVSGTARTDLTLPTNGAYGSTITWVSDQSAIISEQGKVIRPAKGLADAKVTLTATLKKGTSMDTKVFLLTVPAQTITDEEAVEAVKASLRVTYDGIATSVSLPKMGANHVAIQWSLQDQAHSAIVELDNGHVNRAAVSKVTDVVLIASIKLGSAQSQKAFSIRVLPLGDVPLVHPITVTDSHIKGTAKPGTDIHVRTGSTLVGTDKADQVGAFGVKIPAQSVGTVLEVIASNPTTHYQSEAAYVLVTESTGAPSIINVGDITASVRQGANYTLPTTVLASMSDGTKQQVQVDSWNPNVADTSSEGTFSFEGTVEGYAQKVRLSLEVTKEGAGLTVAQALALPQGTTITLEAYVQTVEPNAQFAGYGIYLADQPGDETTDALIVKFANADRNGPYAVANATGKKVKITGVLHDKAYFSKKGIATYTHIQLVP
ncbi:endonuclease [Brevibacillus laterosporus]|uniref:immunoglobulin-like domain-containing protein n=1 Tax=Brevibacillus laterosporus TaxID=1465 RepID=UPI000E76F993|nr:immunoglobulin-like domain-containing protein [Brevibacillus laterosporus]RJL07726.1 endonuclease [Brevibacillus laterosporus]TPH10801.1 endonuclease [Brevibacillus laterosporus]